MKSFYYWFLCGLLTMSALSCSHMNDLHDPYLRDGAIIYTGRVDSAKVFAGEKRLLLRYYTTDPKAKNLLVYWNIGTESRIFDIPGKNSEDPVDVYLNDLEEGPVYFELFTLNEDMQNRSVPLDADGMVYGDIYRSSLMNRNLNSIIRDLDNTVTIIWYSADSRSIGCEVSYTNRSGVTVEYIVPSDESETVLIDVHENAEYITYRTIYLPEPDAIDVFYTTLRQVNIRNGEAIEIGDNGATLPDLEGIDFY